MITLFRFEQGWANRKHRKYTTKINNTLTLQYSFGRNLVKELLLISKKKKKKVKTNLYIFPPKMKKKINLAKKKREKLTDFIWSSEVLHEISGNCDKTCHCVVDQKGAYK